MMTAAVAIVTAPHDRPEGQWYTFFVSGLENQLLLWPPTCLHHTPNFYPDTVVVLYGTKF